MIENRSDKKLRILETSERRGEVSKIAAGRTEPEKALPRPDPEVPAKAGLQNRCGTDRAREGVAATRPGSSCQGNPSPVFSPL